jgi:hypothetical protein
MANDLYIQDNAPEVKAMNWGLFESFCEMLESIPIKAVLRAVAAERKMVEDDLEKKRTEPDEYVFSVLGFCNFLMLAVCGVYESVALLPAEHRAYYRKIVQRLVEAGELPSEITGHFEKIFSPAFDSPASGDRLNKLISIQGRFTHITN